MNTFAADCLNIAERITPCIVPPHERTVFGEDAQTASPDDIAKETARCLGCGCVAASPSDMAPAIIALGGEIVTTKRRVAAKDFFKAGVCTSTILEGDEVVTEIVIPKPPEGCVQLYNKFRYRKSIDFPVIGLAACFSLSGGIFTDAKIVLSAVSPSPMELKAVCDFLLGKRPTEELACQAADIAVSGAIPLLENKYKIKITRALVRRAIAAQCE